MTAADLIEFEARVAEAFGAATIPGPVHLSGGNEEELIGLFKGIPQGDESVPEGWFSGASGINRDDWVFSTYRSHYHALLHGIDPEWLLAEIIAGRSMNIYSEKPKFFTSAIVGGCLSIAVGVAAALKRSRSPQRVWCFVGDMAATTGAFHEARKYAVGNALPIMFVIEDNGLSCDSPTVECWGPPGTRGEGDRQMAYTYKRVWPHVGVGKFVQF
jgi:pyruvate dehydrogenase E1 component alpha subunit